MSNGSWRPSNVVAASCLACLIFYYWTTTATTPFSRRRTARGVTSAYDRPGTLSHLATRLDRNLTGESIPFWSPFDSTDLSPLHGRLLEQLLIDSSSSSSSSTAPKSNRIVEPIETETHNSRTVLFFGDSNERGIVDELCIKLGSYPTVVSSKEAPSRSEKWHADSHVCELDFVQTRRRRGGGGGGQSSKLRLASFMSYGVLIEKASQLWEHKLELDHGPWAVEERIELAKGFVDKMGWDSVDLIVFNSNLWDLMYLHDTHLRLQTPYEFSLASSSLDAYIARSLFALSRLSETFPSTRIYLRTLHPLHPGREIDFFNERRVTQLNQASLEIVSRLERDRGGGVRLMDLGKVLQGWPTSREGGGGGDRNILKDKVHLGWNPGLWMYGEMVLDALEHSL